MENVFTNTVAHYCELARASAQVRIDFVLSHFARCLHIELLQSVDSPDSHGSFLRETTIVFHFDGEIEMIEPATLINYQLNGELAVMTHVGVLPHSAEFYASPLRWAGAEPIDPLDTERVDHPLETCGVANANALPSIRIVPNRRRVYVDVPAFVLLDTELFARLEEFVDKVKSERNFNYPLCFCGRELKSRLAAVSRRTGLSAWRFNPSDYLWKINYRPKDRPEVGQIAQAFATPCRFLGVPATACQEAPVELGEDWFTADDPVWKLRESARTVFGPYVKLPSEVQEAIDPAKIEGHYPHMALQPQHEGMIAITKDNRAGVQNRQTVMRAGKFLRQYGWDSLTDEGVKQLAAIASSGVKFTFKSSREREDYSRIYRTGPNSCMAYGPGNSRGSFSNQHNLMVNGKFVHPTEVYAHPKNNLELHWAEFQGSVVARAIVNTERRCFSRIYAKESPSHATKAFFDHLRDLGFSQEDQEGETLADEPLLKFESDTKALICPYLDPGNVGVFIEVDCLRGGGSYKANHATGTLEAFTGEIGHKYRGETGGASSWSCACCDEDYCENDDRFTDEDGNDICEECRNNSHQYAWCAHLNEARWVHDSRNIYEIYGGDTFHGCDSVYFGGNPPSYYGFVELSGYYDAPTVCRESEATFVAEGDYEGGYLATEDLASNDLFLHPDDACAYEVSNWVVIRHLDGTEEVVERDSVDEDLFELDPSESSEESELFDLDVFVEQEPDLFDDEEEGDEATPAVA